MKIQEKKLTLEEAHSMIEEMITNGIHAEVNITAEIIEGGIEFTAPYLKHQQMTMDDCMSRKPDEED